MHIIADAHSSSFFFSLLFCSLSVYHVSGISIIITILHPFYRFQTIPFNVIIVLHMLHILNCLFTHCRSCFIVHADEFVYCALFCLSAIVDTRWHGPNQTQQWFGDHWSNSASGGEHWAIREFTDVQDSETVMCNAMCAICSASM